MRASSRTDEMASCLSSSLGKEVMEEGRGRGEGERQGSVRRERNKGGRKKEKITGSLRIGVRVCYLRISTMLGWFKEVGSI